MSSKWRALQHRHRYTYTAVVFPQSYVDALNLSLSNLSSPSFFSELDHLVSMNSIYSQVNGVKNVASAFSELVSSQAAASAAVSVAARFYLEILFLENSLPLHRTLISVLVKNCNFLPEIRTSFRCLCEEYLGGKGKRFSVCRAALSVLSYPKLGLMMETVEECAVSVALDVVYSLNSVISEVNDGARLSPVVMEQCQEAMSCLYYLLQRFPSRFLGAGSCNSELVIPDDSTVFEIVLNVILKILKSSAFSRDCLVAAGVSFCAALQVCTNPEELATFIVKACFQVVDFNYTMYSENGFEGLGLNVPYKGDLCSEIGDFSVLSRLCLLRGILTAVPRTVLNSHFVRLKDGMKNSHWTILFNGILAELCSYCENPIDSHFNFHALTVTQICLQQIKTSFLANLSNISEIYDPFPEETASRILRIIWNNLEDPLNQTVKQVHLIFDLLLDIQSSLQSLKGDCKHKSFLQHTTLHLLRLGARCKGRYVPLASLTKRLSAKTILEMSPNILYETTHAYMDDDVCCSATSFLKCFLEFLRDECWSSEGIEKGYITFRSLCLPPILYGIVSGISKLRTNLNTYALSVVLEVDVDSIFSMLAFISVVGQREKDREISYPELSGAKLALTVDQHVAALVSFLKVSRLIALIEGDIDWFYDSLQDENDWNKNCFDRFALVCIKGVDVKIPVAWLVLALTHADETLRVDAAESLFLNPKTSALPSLLELSLMKEAVPLNMRCCSTAFQMKWTSLYRKFFSRVRTALDRQVKQGSWQANPCSNSNKGDNRSDTKKMEDQRAQELFRFMKWLSSFLFFSCYPSAPYERKIMAMELILIMVNVWPVIPIPPQVKASYTSPYNESFTSPDSTLSLVGSIVDSWDRLRENSFRILLHFPTPLPGISGEDAVKEVITWAKRLVCSPRVRESDAGALTLRLIFRKYVLDLGWIVNASVNFICMNPQFEGINGDSTIFVSKIPVIEYIFSLVDWLQVAVEEGEKDLSEACKSSFVHGVLLTLRYTFEELDWNSAAVMSGNSEMRKALEKLLELIMRITSLALWVVSADALCLPDDMEDMGEEGTFLSDMLDVVDHPDESPELQINSSILVDDARPAAQVVMVGCWLAMKEVSLLLGTIIRKVPLPTFTLSDTSSCISDATMIDMDQLNTIGNHFLEVLLKMKHNGAIDKTRAGFTALCHRLLCSNDPRLCKLTESWMEQLMERTVVKGQTVDDLLRRSAGIPAAFIALFLSEPEGTPKKLLPRALRWLIDVVNLSLITPGEVDSQNRVKHKSSRMKLNNHSLEMEIVVNGANSKSRDEGVIPTVHAFNVLKAAFNDTHLATDTSGFWAEALIVSICSFSSPYWEIRNSACLAYTALVRRMIGFLNVQKLQSAKRALTGLEFFHRYPALHPFLFNELKIATDSLGGGHSPHSESDMAKVVHPSLCPILILLSRLRPSLIDSETKSSLDPFLFMPFIRKCATQNNFRVRLLASRALTGLVSNEKLLCTLHNIASGLPCGRNQMGQDPCVSFNSMHGMLLQLCSLLDNNCRNSIDVSKKDKLLGELIQVLVKCSWIGSPRFCPCPTLNGSYLLVLDRILDIAKTCGLGRLVSTTRTMLHDLSLECLENEVSSQVAFYDPTKAELRRQAAVSYFSCFFGESPQEAEEDSQMIPSLPLASNFSKRPGTETTRIRLQEKIMSCISDSSYEVRLVSLKWLLRFLKPNEYGRTDTDSFCTWAKANLQPTLMQLLDAEEHPKCVYYLLKIIFAWNLQQFQQPGNDICKDTVYLGSMGFESLFHFWDKLVFLNKVVTHMKTREALLHCMGVCVKRFARLFTRAISRNVDQPARWAVIYECIDYYISLIKQHSASSEPVNMRKAAAEAMVASGLLDEAILIGSLVSNEQIPSKESLVGEDQKQVSYFKTSDAANLYACGIVNLWFTGIKLLEDEDVGLRQKLAVDVQACFISKGFGDGQVPLQVEKVIESSFNFLSSVFSHWIEYFDHLLRWVIDSGKFVIAKGDLVRRLFDKEIDNHHEERLLICQLCCSQLEKLSVSKYWVVDPSEKCLGRGDIEAVVQKWRTKFVQELKYFSRNYLEAEGRNEWIGGIGNHKDAFTSSYANLLGLYALSQCPFDQFHALMETEIGKPFLSDLIELREFIRPFLRSPLISNLYLVVMKSYEKMFGIISLRPMDLEHPGGCCFWEDFDPYFLLR